MSLMSLEDLEEYVLSVGCEDMGQEDGRFAGGYWLQQHHKECARLLDFLQPLEFENYLEIGVAAGGFTRLLCDIVKVKNVVLIDDGKHRTSKYLEENVKRLRNTGIVYKCICDSHSEIAREFLEQLGLIFDLVMLDGDHTYEGVSQDFELIKQFSKHGTLIVLHDTMVHSHSQCGKIGVHHLFRQLKNSPNFGMLAEFRSKFGIGVVKVK